MNKFDILNRFSGAVQFTAEIDCPEDAPTGVKIGLAVRWALKSRANLSGANLKGANLSDANLSGPYMSGAKWRDEITIIRRPIQIYGLHDDWAVTILDQHMQIGCELHRLDEWEAFDDRRICEMDGRSALMFWRKNKDALLAMAKADGRGASAAKTTEAA